MVVNFIGKKKFENWIRENNNGYVWTHKMNHILLFTDVWRSSEDKCQTNFQADQWLQTFYKWKEMDYRTFLALTSRFYSMPVLIVIQIFFLWYYFSRPLIFIAAVNLYLLVPFFLWSTRLILSISTDWSWLTQKIIRQCEWCQTHSDQKN